ncbi:hypothetical protein D3C75_699390 [compost metagenome]
MAFLAPVIRKISGGVLHHAHPDFPKLLCAPQRFPGDARMFGGGECSPVGRIKRQVSNAHGFPYYFLQVSSN